MTIRMPISIITRSSRTPFTYPTQTRRIRHIIDIRLFVSCSRNNIKHLFPSSAARASLTANAHKNNDAGNYGTNKPGPDDPESVDDPGLHEFLHGMGSSGQPYDRPADAPDPMDEDDIARALIMGSWRLRDQVCAPIEALVASIENSLRSHLKSDLRLCDLPKQFKYMDSLDPGGTSPASYQKPDPPKEDTLNYPRLQIENRAYTTYAFRKVHLEVAVRQDGLQVLHCVMFPWINFDLPILSLDVVIMGGRLSLAIIDPCPVVDNKSLPLYYLQSVEELRAMYGVATNRYIPEWGEAIFSQSCVCMRPTESKDIAAFLKYAIALIDFHIQVGRLAAPVRSGGSESEAMAERRRKEIRMGHQRYCTKQLENDKTRRVLEKSFGDEMTDEYMKTVMFDVEK